MGRIRVSLDVIVEMDVDPIDEESVLLNMEDYIVSVIELDYTPHNVWCEVQDVGDIDERV